MPWCPKCGIEYREGFETCSDCGCELSKEPLPGKTDSIPEAESESKEAFLALIENSVEADMIEGLLKAEEIPVLKKYGDIGGMLNIYSGVVTTGVELYVPSHLLEKAKEILETSQGALGGTEIPEEELEAQALAAQPEDEYPEDEEECGNDEEPGDEAAADEGYRDEKPFSEESESEEPVNKEPANKQSEENTTELQGVSFLQRFIRLFTGK